MFLNSQATVKGKVHTKRKCLSDSKFRGKGALLTKQGAAPGVPVPKGGEPQMTLRSDNLINRKAPRQAWRWQKRQADMKCAQIIIAFHGEGLTWHPCPEEEVQ